MTVASTVGTEKDRMVLGLFDTVGEAAQAIEDVLAVGVLRDDISLIARQDASPNPALRAMAHDSATAAHEETRRQTRETSEEDSTAPVPPSQDIQEAGAGVLWARLDGMGIILDFLPLPGIGWIMTAGPLSTILRSPDAGLGQSATLLGAAFGPTVAGLIGTLVYLGLPEEDARLYVEGIRLGGTLVVVPAETEGIIEDLKSVLHYNNAVGVHGRDSVSGPIGIPCPKPILPTRVSMPLPPGATWRK